MSWQAFDVDAALVEVLKRVSPPAKPANAANPAKAEAAGEARISRISGVSGFSRGKYPFCETPPTTLEAGNQAAEAILSKAEGEVAAELPTPEDPLAFPGPLDPDTTPVVCTPEEERLAIQAESAPPRRMRDRQETSRGGASRSPTAYFVEATSRAWCPSGAFETRLQRTVQGRCLVRVEAKLGLLLRCVEADLLDHRQAREAAEKLTAGETVEALL